MGKSFIKTSYLAWLKDVSKFFMVISSCFSIRIFNYSTKVSVQRFFSITATYTDFHHSNFRNQEITAGEVFAVNFL